MAYGYKKQNSYFGWYWVEMKCKKVKTFQFKTESARSSFIAKLEKLGCEVYRIWYS